jgi:hypothetical protein
LVKRNDGGNIFSEAPALSAEDDALVKAYERSERTLDDLPYTHEFDQIYDAVEGSQKGKTKAEIFRRLHTLRKAGRLPRLGRAATPPIKVSAAEEAQLESIVIEHIGTLGQRDQLPYGEKFDRVHSDFNRMTGRELSPHDLWRLLAKIAK